MVSRRRILAPLVISIIDIVYRTWYVFADFSVEYYRIRRLTPRYLDERIKVTLSFPSRQPCWNNILSATTTVKTTKLDKNILKLEKLETIMFYSKGCCWVIWYLLYILKKMFLINVVCTRLLSKHLNIPILKQKQWSDSMSQLNTFFFFARSVFSNLLIWIHGQLKTVILCVCIRTQ